MSYASIAAHNSEGGGAKPSQEWLEGSLPAPTDGSGNAGAVRSNVDVDSGSINVVPHDSNLDNLRTDSAEKAERAERDASDHQHKLDQEAAHDATALREGHDARMKAGGHEPEIKLDSTSGSGSSSGSNSKSSKRTGDSKSADKEEAAQDLEKNAKKAANTADQKYAEGKDKVAKEASKAKEYVDNTTTDDKIRDGKAYAEEKLAQGKQKASKEAAKAREYVERTTTDEKIRDGKAFAQKEASQAKAFAEEQAQSAKAWAEREAPKLTEDAKKANQTLSRKAKEISAQVQEGWVQLSSDPKAWGTLLGAVNVALLGGLGYFVYRERNNPRTWDRRLVSAVTVGVLGLLGGQGYVAAETAREQRRGQGKARK